MTNWKVTTVSLVYDCHYPLRPWSHFSRGFHWDPATHKYVSALVGFLGFKLELLIERPVNLEPMRYPPQEKGRAALQANPYFSAAEMAELQDTSAKALMRKHES